MRGVLTVALVGSAWLAGTAAAQPAAPGERAVADLVAEAEQLAQGGKIAESLPLFREAARREPSARHECLVALTYFRLGRPPEARLRLDRAVAAAGSGGARPEWCGDGVLGRDVDRALAEGAFAPVDVVVDPAGAALRIGALAAEEEVVAPVSLWLPWGTQRVRAEKNGYVPRELDVVVGGKAKVPVRIELETWTRATPSTEDRPPEPGIPGPEAGQRKRDQGRAGVLVGWMLVGAGVAALGVGAGFHVAAAQSRSSAEELFAGPAFDAESQKFEKRRNAAVGLYVGGAVVAAIGVWLVAR